LPIVAIYDQSSGSADTVFIKLHMFVRTFQSRLKTFWQASLQETCPHCRLFNDDKSVANCK